MKDDKKLPQKIEGFENGQGQKLDIKKNLPPPTNSNSNNKSDNGVSKNTLRVSGIVALLASITFFVLAGIFSPFYAIGGAVGFVIAALCIGFAMGKDYNDSQNISTSQQKSVLNNLRYGLEDYRDKKTNISIKNNNNSKNLENNVRYDKKDYYKQKNNFLEK